CRPDGTVDDWKVGFVSLYTLGVGGLLLYFLPKRGSVSVFTIGAFLFLTFQAFKLLNSYFEWDVFIAPGIGVFFYLIRWLLLGMAFHYGFIKKTLTFWIFVSLFLGVSIGHDFPMFGQDLRLLSQIFLKLIKVIIGLFLFATLVYGISVSSYIC